MKPLMRYASRVTRGKNILLFTFHISLIVILASVFAAALLYGMLAEQDLRELRYYKGWYKWQPERALAEHYAETQWTR